jgi:hypothetical protein
MRPHPVTAAAPRPLQWPVSGLTRQKSAFHRGAVWELERSNGRSLLVCVDPMVGPDDVAGHGVVHASPVPHAEPNDPACRYAAEDNKADPSDFYRQNH